MRVVFVGACDSTVIAARVLLRQGHEVVVIELSRERIDELYEGLDCSFLHGDGSNPEILKEARPQETDFLFCVSDHDQTNILASLLGRSLGFRHVVTRIDDPAYEPLCLELGLEHTFVPPRTIGRYIADLTHGIDMLQYSVLIRGEARLFMFNAREDAHGVRIGELGLPDPSRVVCVYRGDALILPEPTTRLEEGDEVLLICTAEVLTGLVERFATSPATVAP